MATLYCHHYRHRNNTHTHTRFPYGMEIELDLSVTRPAGNLTFTSTESDAIFLLLGHLPGIAQEKIEVSVNESEGQLCVSGTGDKSSLESVVGRRLRLKNEFEIGSFRKVFRIPSGVVLDQIEVGFCEEEGILVILMPKSSKGEVLGRAMEEVEEERGSPTDKEDDVIAEPEADVKAPEQEQQKEREKSPTRKEDKLIPKPEVEGQVKENERKLKPNGAKSSGSENGNGEQESKDVEAKTEIPQVKEEETKVNQVGAAETKIDQEEEKKETEAKIDQEEEKKETEAKIHQEEEKEQDMATEIHQEHIEKDEKEESRKQLDVPEKPSIQIKPSDRDEQPAPKPIDTAEDEEPIHGESDQHKQSENEDETPRSIATEEDHDFDQPKEGQQTDQDHREGQGGEHQPEQRQVPRPIAEPKSDGGVHRSDPTPEMDKPIEDERKEGNSKDGEGKKGKGPRKDEDRRRIKPRRSEGGDGGITPPILVATAFLVSLVGLVFKLLRNRRRR